MNYSWKRHLQYSPVFSMRPFAEETVQGIIILEKNMKIKKLVFYLPAIIFTIFYSFAALGGIGTIQPVAVLWLASLWIAGIFLSKAIYWGGLIGFIPGVCFIYMGTQETGQILKETPFGVIILLYYALCVAYCVYKKKHTKND